MVEGRSRGCSVGRHHGWRAAWPATTVLTAALLLGACSSETNGDATLRAAEAKVVSARASLDDAKAQAATKRTEFCSASTGYITALDRYGDVLNATTPTVGDVKTAGRDLAQPGQDAVASGQAAAEATRAVTTAELELATAEAELAAVRAGSTGTAPPTQSPSSTAPVTTSASTAPAVPNETIVRVQQAESEFATAQGSISDDTALRVASQQFNAAAVSLELAWLGLYSDAGCLTDPQQQKAVKAVQDYTKALQQDLLDAGYYKGKVDGVYGPTTVAAVEELQKAHGLPVTGAMDKATEAGLRTDLAAKGGAAAGAEVASTAAVQQTLKLAGHWDGPVDGQWTPALTEALKQAQTELKVPASGTVDAATITAVEKAIEEAGQTPTVTLTVTTTTTVAPSAEPSPSSTPPSPVESSTG